MIAMTHDRKSEQKANQRKYEYATNPGHDAGAEKDNYRHPHNQNDAQKPARQFVNM
ncbi:hypothetical protein C5S35_18320 [Candidatus Methanophagaceae archaeon]|nr:hypothetical protein C5S35_18320 [Methanophagales archaeon]